MPDRELEAKIHGDFYGSVQKVYQELDGTMLAPTKCGDDPPQDPFTLERLTQSLDGGCPLSRPQEPSWNGLLRKNGLSISVSSSVRLDEWGQQIFELLDRIAKVSRPLFGACSFFLPNEEFRGLNKCVHTPVSEIGRCGIPPLGIRNYYGQKLWGPLSHLDFESISERITEHDWGVTIDLLRDPWLSPIDDISEKFHAAQRYLKDVGVCPDFQLPVFLTQPASSWEPIDLE